MFIKCIHTGDLHLGMEFKNASFNKNHSKIRRRELWETFNRIIDRANEIKTNLLLIAGDLFEEEYCTIGDIKRINSKFKELSDTKVVIVSGNHDPYGDKSLYNLIDWNSNVFIFRENSINKIEFEDINTIIWGLSWDKKEEKRSLIDNITIDDDKKINILLIHGDTFSKDSQYLPIDKNSLKNFDYVALGHIHKPQFLDERIAYCGSPEPLDFGETGDHGIIEGTISKEEINMNFVPFSKRSFIIKDVIIDENMSYDDIIKKISAIDDDKNKIENLYRVVLKGIIDRDLSLNLNDIIEDLKGEIHYLEIINKLKLDYDLDKLQDENTDNIIGYFIKEMKELGLNEPSVKDGLYYGLEVLLSEKVRK